MKVLAAIRLVLSNKAAGRDAQAQQLYEVVRNADTPIFEELIGLASAAKSVERYDDEARFLSRAVIIRDDDPSLFLGLGRAMTKLEQFELAALAFEQAFSLDPGIVEAQVCCARALSRLDRESDALAVLDAALERNPGHPELLFERVRVRKDAADISGVVDDCLALWNGDVRTPEVVGLLAYHEMMLGRWAGLEQHRQVLLDAVSAASEPDSLSAPINPYTLLFLDGDPRRQYAAARRWVERSYSKGLSREFSNLKTSRVDGRITLAYLSSDFRQHPVGLMVVGMIEKHDREKFKVILFSTGADDGSPVYGRLIQAADLFLDISGLTDENAARAILNKEVDILVDLNGLTSGTRLALPAQRVAPVQVSYLGYPGTSGASFIDYAVVDPIVAPQGADAWFCEKLIRMPHCYQVNDDERTDGLSELSRAHFGVPEDAFVMCSFNQTVKFNPALFDTWCGILNRISNSVLWVLDTSVESRENLCAEASKRGVSKERLLFAPLTTHDEHLARYAVADLFLDTFPYNAHTTGTDALWMGCPLVTLEGACFASRVASSLLTAVGLPQLITRTPDEYADVVIRLASDRDELAALRAHLEAGRHRFALFDTSAFTSSIERAYEEIWSRWRDGNPAKAINLR